MKKVWVYKEIFTSGRTRYVAENEGIMFCDELSYLAKGLVRDYQDEELEIFFRPPRDFKKERFGLPRLCKSLTEEEIWYLTTDLTSKFSARIPVGALNEF